MTILWLGPLHSDYALRKRKAVNQAAVKWTRGLIDGLKTNGVKVIGLTHCYEQAWPKGELFPGISTDFDPSIRLDWCRYINIKGLRNGLLSWAYRRKIRDILLREHVDGIIAYNVWGLPCHVTAMRVASSINVPCYPIILDDDDPRDDQWQALLRNTDGARGVVFLSNWMFKNCPTKLPLLHLDGGSPKWHGDEAEEKTEKNLIVYAGGLDKWRGLDFLIAVVKNLKKSEYRFVICGKCDKDEILKKFDHDPRVDVRGFVSDEELHEICLRAALFLNTRDPSLEKNMVVNFPSKILNYLAYGKPVVSTALTSFSDDYQRFLQIVKEDNPIMFGKKVQEVLEWDTSVRRRHYDELKEWFCANKLWRDQAKRLLDWIK